MGKVDIDINFVTNKFIEGGLDSIEDYKNKAQKGLSTAYQISGRK